MMKAHRPKTAGKKKVNNFEVKKTGNLSTVFVSDGWSSEEDLRGVSSATSSSLFGLGLSSSNKALTFGLVVIPKKY